MKIKSLARCLLFLLLLQQVSAVFAASYAPAQHQDSSVSAKQSMMNDHHSQHDNHAAPNYHHPSSQDKGNQDHATVDGPQHQNSCCDLDCHCPIGTCASGIVGTYSARDLAQGLSDISVLLIVVVPSRRTETLFRPPIIA